MKLIFTLTITIYAIWAFAGDRNQKLVQNPYTATSGERLVILQAEGYAQDGSFGFGNVSKARAKAIIVATKILHAHCGKFGGKLVGTQTYEDSGSVGATAKIILAQLCSL